MSTSSGKLGRKVRALRRREGITQAALAEKLGISASYLNLIEHDRRPLSAPLLIKLAQLYDLDLKSFAGGEDARLLEDLLEVFAMDNRADIEAICEVLEKEHTDIAQALTRGKDEENARRASVAAQRRRSSAGIAGTKALGTPRSDHDEVHSRISVIEDTLRMCDAEIRSIQEHLQLLPQLCELLNIPLTSLDDAQAS